MRIGKAWKRSGGAKVREATTRRRRPRGEDVGGSANDVRPLPKATPLRRLWRQGEKSSLFLGVASGERGRKSNTMVGWETVLPWKTTRLGWKLAVAESFQRCDEGPGDDG